MAADRRPRRRGSACGYRGKNAALPSPFAYPPRRDAQEPQRVEPLPRRSQVVPAGRDRRAPATRARSTGPGMPAALRTLSGSAPAFGSSAIATSATTDSADPDREEDAQAVQEPAAEAPAPSARCRPPSRGVSARARPPASAGRSSRPRTRGSPVPAATVIGSTIDERRRVAQHPGHHAADQDRPPGRRSRSRTPRSAAPVVAGEGRVAAVRGQAAEPGEARHEHRDVGQPRTRRTGARLGSASANQGSSHSPYCGE